MKRIVAVMLGAAMLLSSLTACGGGGEKKVSDAVSGRPDSEVATSRITTAAADTGAVTTTASAVTAQSTVTPDSARDDAAAGTPNPSPGNASSAVESTPPPESTLLEAVADEAAPAGAADTEGNVADADGAADGAADAADDAAEPVSAALDQYYVNDNFMLEALVNDDVIIEEQGANLLFTTPEQHAAVVVSIMPGIQNLAAAGELALNMVTSSLEEADVGEISDGSLFGERAKSVEYSAADGDESISGIQVAAIINQSCYFVNALAYDDISEEEGELMSGLISGMSVLKPDNVDQETQTASYVSKYEEQLNAQTVKPAESSKAASVDEWEYLPYEFYSWWGDPGDQYDSYPDYYFEPDWDYYSDPGDYWSWGWDESGSWGFYDEYADSYDYDAYQEYDDYYDEEWSDPGDAYDEWYDAGAWNDDEYYEANDAGWEDEEYYEANDAGWEEEEYYEANDAGWEDEEYYEANDAGWEEAEYYEANDAGWEDEEYYEANDAGWEDEGYYEANDAGWEEEW